MDMVHHSLDRYPGSYVSQYEKFHYNLVVEVAIAMVWMKFPAMPKRIGRSVTPDRRYVSDSCIKSP
jgi:hypothetical protein